MASCRFCGAKMGWASGKAYGSAAEDIGVALSVLIGITHVVESSDPAWSGLPDFIDEGAQLARALHVAGHSRGIVPDRAAWHEWERVSLLVMNQFKQSYPDGMALAATPETGREARELILAGWAA